MFLDIQKCSFLENKKKLSKNSTKTKQNAKKIARENRRFTLASLRQLHPKRLAFLQENDQHPAHVQIDGTDFIE